MALESASDRSSLALEAATPFVWAAILLHRFKMQRQRTVTQRFGGSGAVRSFYLFACTLEWEKHEDPSAAWELIAAAQSADAETRAQARSLLAGSRHLAGMGRCDIRNSAFQKKRQDCGDRNESTLQHGNHRELR